MFALYIALFDKMTGGCHTLNDHGNLTINNGIIMEKSWNFISQFLWEPRVYLKWDSCPVANIPKKQGLPATDKNLTFLHVSCNIPRVCIFIH